jgi:hypothetical protein
LGYKDGQVYSFTISETNENSKYMPTAKGNFGLLGMMYEITMRVFPLKIVEVDDEHIQTGSIFGPDVKVFS